MSPMNSSIRLRIMTEAPQVYTVPRNPARSAWRSRSCTKAPESARSRQLSNTPPTQQKRAQLTPVPTLAAHFESHKIIPKMEPGGIEPPCRDCQQDASTSVVVGLISILHRATTPCPSIQPLETSLPACQETPHADQPEDRDSPPYRASSGESTASIRLRVRTAVRQI